MIASFSSLLFVNVMIKCFDGCVKRLLHMMMMIIIVIKVNKRVYSEKITNIGNVP